mmetsp:Transcript_38020/g.53071  ORF Transcript_38020/g.53071 Transcript_38020/m.53071 type:complete len:101 (-) Transcript_38020:119-421(-)
MEAMQAKVVMMLLSDSTLRKASDKAFERYDRDCSGYLDQAEVDLAVSEVLEKCHVPAPHGVGRQAMKAFDKDGSGTIDREEFFLIVQQAGELAKKKSTHY